MSKSTLHGCFSHYLYFSKQFLPLGKTRGIVIIMYVCRRLPVKFSRQHYSSTIFHPILIKSSRQLFYTLKMKPIHFCHGSMILGGFRGPKRWILLFGSLAQQLCHFSSDFDKIFKIAFLYIKDDTYSFLSQLGDFSRFRGPNQRIIAISGLLAQYIYHF